MNKHIFIVAAVTCLMHLGAPARESLTISQLLEKYAETQNKLQSSFAIKTETTSKWHLVSPRVTAKGTLHEFCDLRWDGNRTSTRTRLWGKLSSWSDIIPKDNPKCNIGLWDGESIFNYMRENEDSPGLVIIDRRGPAPDKPKQYGTVERIGGPLTGFFAGDLDRVDSILRRANSISLRTATQSVGRSQCYVIDAVANGGEYTLWIDPRHGYNIARAVVKKGQGAPAGNQSLGKDEHILCSLDNTRFEKIGDLWVPMEADIESSNKRFNGTYNTSQHVRRAEVLLDPDHEKLGSFVPDDIPDGAIATIIAPSGKYIPIKYTWQDGRLIPNTDEAVISEIDKMTDKIIAEGGLPGMVPLKTEASTAPDDVLYLLDRYAAAQYELRSFIAEAVTTLEYEHASGRARRPEIETSEFRTDGSRARWRGCTRTGPITQDKARCQSSLWDGKSLIEYKQRSGSDTATVFVDPGESSSKRTVAQYYRGAPLLGVCPGDYDRVDSILRQAHEIYLAKKTEQIADSPCQLIRAATKRGDYAIWIDPKHGYNIAKIEIQRAKGDLIRHNERVRISMFFSMKNVRFEKIYGLWVPMEADMETTENLGAIVKSHHKRTRMILNPDHQVLKSFVPDDIPDGTKVSISGVTTPGYRWQDGRAVAQTSK
jgi:hypothetical protein